MRGNACPSSIELTRRFSSGADEHMTEHLDQCEKCSGEWTSFERVLKIAKELPDGRPLPDRAEAVRSALLIKASEPAAQEASRHRAALLCGAIAASIALAVGAYFLLNPGKRAAEREMAGEVHRASVYPHKGAAHEIVEPQPNEIVRLIQGTIAVEVEALKAGERFRVVTGDAEVEVRGTAFDVTAKDDRLIAVSVSSGKVEVRPTGSATVVLNPGERWARPESMSPAADEESRMEEAAIAEEMINMESGKEALFVHKQRERASRSFSDGRQVPEPEKSKTKTRERTIEPGPAEIGFNKGWEALRSGAPMNAADWFGRSIAAAGSNRIAEDASYWMAVAYGRAGARHQAIDALRAFLASYPGSPRSGEASAMLGWKLFDSGDLNGAERLFHTALGDPVPRVQKSAEKGLNDIESRREKERDD
jgi:TolA-binding protein